MRKMILKSLLSISVLLGLSACGGMSPEVATHADKGKIKPLTKALYIHIDFDNGKFTPVNISSKSEAGHTSTLVISKNGTVSLKGFRNGVKVSCGKRRGNTSSIYCQNDTPFFSNAVGVRIKPYGAIVLVTDNLYEYLSEHNLYDKINAYNDLNSYVNKELKKLEPFVLAEQTKYEKLKPKYSIVINDKSGLYDKSIDFDNAINYKHTQFKNASYILPVYKVTDSNAFFADEKKKFTAAYPSIESELKANINKNNDTVKMYYQTPSSDKYYYEMHEVKEVSFKKKSKIIVDINSANIKFSYPVLTMKNKTVSISDGKDNTAKFDNSSNDFVSIKSISYYFNKDIITDTDFDKNSILEIPPESYIELSKDTAETKFEEGLYFEETTAKKLKAKKVSYGLAVKYVSSQSEKVKTLYKTKKTDMLSLVKYYAQ